MEEHSEEFFEERQRHLERLAEEQPLISVEKPLTSIQQPPSMLSYGEVLTFIRGGN